jgi:hypothetical protein
MPASQRTDIYLETGSKRTFACSVEWPGWSRSGQDEASALQAVMAYGKRYRAAISSARLGFQPPEDIGSFKVVERLKGDMTTDFGTPGRIPAVDSRTVGDVELRRLQAILKACWRTFDRIAAKATGKPLRLGPRGGGRDRQKIISHVMEAEHAYAVRLGIMLPTLGADATPAELDQFRKAILQAVAASAHGEFPRQGPRGGKRLPAPYFVRRSAWHLLDHAWEIEDRLEG